MFKDVYSAHTFGLRLRRCGEVKEVREVEDVC